MFTNRNVLRVTLWGTMLLVVVALFVSTGCAKVRVKKVPYQLNYYLDKEPQDDKQGGGDGLQKGTVDERADEFKFGIYKWNKMQEEADKMEGVRYYLPRPYVVVKKEFPVGGGVFFLKGTAKGGKLLTIETGSLPLEYQGLFPATPSLKNVKDMTKNAGKSKTRGKKRLQSKNAGKDAAKGTADDGKDAGEKIKVTLVEDKKNLTVAVKNTLTDKTVNSKDETIIFQVNLAQAALANRKVDVNLTDLYLIPRVQGEHKVENKVKFTATTPAVKPDDDKKKYTWTGEIKAEKIPTFASVAVELKDKDGKENLLLHNGGTDIVNPFAGAAPAKKEKQDKAKTETEETKTMSTAAVKTGGDPKTPPIIKVCDLYDITFLPDYSEQYVIQVRGGLGKAKADIGLEYGWNVEQFSTEVDNTELGKFIFENVSKVVDLGITALSPAEAAAEAIDASPEITDDSAAGKTLQSKGVKTVWLKVVVLDMAVPGLHPLAKMRDIYLKTKKRAIADRVEYKTRRSLHIGLVDIEGKAPGNQQKDACEQKLITELSKVEFWKDSPGEIKGTPFAEWLGDDKVKIKKVSAPGRNGKYSINIAIDKDGKALETDIKKEINNFRGELMKFVGKKITCGAISSISFQ